MCIIVQGGVLALVVVLLTRHIFIDFFDRSHVPVPDAATTVTHKHITVNKPDNMAGVSGVVICVLRENGLLVNIVRAPVLSRFIVPFTFGLVEVVLDKTIVKARN